MRVALVTGASRGIGFAIARRLAAEGYELFLVSRSEGQLGEAREICLSAGASQTYSMVADLASASAPEKIASAVAQRFGRLDVLVNNAGVALNRKFGEYTLDDWQKVMRVNARAPFFLTQALLGLLQEQPVSWVVNIASAVAKRGYEQQSLYAASKHALLGMSKSIARDLAGTGVRIHVLMPGGVDTAMIRAMRPDIDTSELIHPDEVASVLMNLLRMDQSAVIDEIEIRRRDKPAWP